MSKEIPLTQGKVALVSDEDYEELMKYRWYAANMGSGRYWIAVRKDKGKTIYLHRQITSCPLGMVVDHIDGNTLNNTRENLRICKQIQNSANCKKNKKNTSGYRNVTWSKTFNVWKVQVIINGKAYQRHFKTLDDAARGADEIKIKYLGEFARLNFPTKVEP